LRAKRVGRTCQAVLEGGEDLSSILTLDEALWVATSAPTSAFNCDPLFLSAVDEDGNGRITSGEIKRAVEWLFGRLADRSRLGEGKAEVALSAVRSEDEAGKELLKAAEYILRERGESGKETISLEEVSDFVDGLDLRPLRGEGVVVPEAAPDPELAEFLADARSTAAKVSKAGEAKQGLTLEEVRSFADLCRTYLAWKNKCDIPPGRTSTEIMPLGPATPEGHAKLKDLEERIDFFFKACRELEFFGGETPGGLGRKAEGEIPDLAAAPLSKPEPGASLPLSGRKVNPVYRPSLAAFREEVVKPLLGRDVEEISEEEWNRIKASFEPYAEHLACKEGAEVETLPLAKVERYASGKLEEAAERLFEADRELLDVKKRAVELRKLILFHAHLYRLVNNFVSFPDLYATDRRALFERGSAVIDGRWFNLAVPVEDLRTHVERARSSNLLVLYLEVTGSRPEEKFTVAVPATSGTRGNLGVGKRGVFFDTEGREFDAVVVELIENPISLLEALAAPFVGAWRFLVGKIETWSERAEKTLQEKLDKALEAVGRGQVAPAAPAARGTAPAGVIAWLSVSVAALSSAWAFMVKQLSALSLSTIVWGVAATVGALSMAVLIPVGTVAFLKLRRQDLSSLLEGSGWAINARMRLTPDQRRHFTRRPHFPLSALNPVRRPGRPTVEESV